MFKSIATWLKPCSAPLVRFLRAFSAASSRLRSLGSFSAIELYLYFVALIAVVGAFRLYVFFAHASTPVSLRRRDSLEWERLYAIGAVGFMTAVGVSVAVLFYNHYNDVLGIYSIVIMMSGLSGLAGRNAGRPWIVLGAIARPRASACDRRDDA